VESVNIPSKQTVIQTLSENLGCSFQPCRGKQIMYKATSGTNQIVICTPQSKLHPRGHGWFDLTTIQVQTLNNANIAFLAIRLPNRIYYIVFEELRKLMPEKAPFNNEREGEHWKFYVWADHIEVRGSNQKFMVQPKLISV